MKVTTSRKRLVELLQQNTGAHSMFTVWTDWVEMCALAISNSCDLVQREAREARYLEIARRYDAAQMARFGDALGALVMAYEGDGFGDVLGETYTMLEITNKRAGQFFTPYHLCRLTAQMTIDEPPADKPFVTVCDPACGAGALLIAAAEVMLDAGINYQERMHVTAQDIDATAVHMAYVQLSLLYIPAVVSQGDTLRMEPARSVWCTPAHILGGWGRRLQGETAPAAVTDALQEVASLAGSVD